ncbi:MAG: hypothetical protein CM1200mP22_27520 [Dehalococcoidia bacterium]|nr:MAG: hypothetical protein CM1200mP22_27520 [Dehalococcoidia bacterium]
MGLDGKIHRLNAEDLLAQALEHEIDHLNGILYIDHLVDHESLYKITQEHDPLRGGVRWRSGRRTTRRITLQRRRH